MRFLITCPGGCSAILGQELKHLGYKPLDTFPTGTYVEGELKDLYTINLRSRVASKVFVQMGSWKAETFEELFDGMKQCSRDQRIDKESAITIHPVAYQSKLHALTSIQSSAHKAVLISLGIGESNNKNPDSNHKVEISIHVVRDQASAYLNTSGVGLHQRGYRTEQGEAPLKENVAAALVLSSGWRRGQLLVDPFCGSGTICIEAALIASNTAPGKWRAFSFQNMKTYDPTLWKKCLEDAQTKRFDKTYEILGCDSDGRMSSIARANAERAGVSTATKFVNKPIEELFLKNDQPTWIITNPPYGKRLEESPLAHDKLMELFALDHIKGCYLSLNHDLHQDEKGWTQKLIRNGADECSIWRKM